MTKKARQRLQGLLAPKKPERSMAIASDYGRHVLDMGLREVMPTGPGDGYITGMRRRALIDEPGVREDDEFHVARKRVLSRSGLLNGLKALIDAALARAGALNSDEDEPDLVALSEEAGLTLGEYEAVMMRSNGFGWSEIAKAQGVNPTTASRAAARGMEKLRVFVLS